MRCSLVQVCTLKSPSHPPTHSPTPKKIGPEESLRWSAAGGGVSLRFVSVNRFTANRTSPSPSASLISRQRCRCKGKPVEATERCVGLPQPVIPTLQPSNRRMKLSGYGFAEGSYWRSGPDKFNEEGSPGQRGCGTTGDVVDTRLLHCLLRCRPSPSLFCTSTRSSPLQQQYCLHPSRPEA